MINKFLQGGKQQDALVKFVQGLAQTLQVDPNLIVLIAQLNPDALKSAVQVFQQTLDMNQAAQAFLQSLQQKSQMAKHGAKLQYIKLLKHQCAEDEELYYYKKGGSVNCGCKKKEQGGEVVQTAKCGAVAKFKKDQQGNKIIKLADATGSKGGFKNAQDAKKKQEDQKKKDFEARWKKGQVRVGKDLQKGANNVTKKEREDVTKDKCGSKIKKHQEGSVIARFKALRRGGNL